MVCAQQCKPSTLRKNKDVHVLPRELTERGNGEHITQRWCIYTSGHELATQCKHELNMNTLGQKTEQGNAGQRDKRNGARNAAMEWITTERSEHNGAEQVGGMCTCGHRGGGR